MAKNTNSYLASAILATLILAGCAKDENEVHFKFENIDGLNPGDAVYRNGVKSGEIRSLKLAGNSPVVTVRLDRGVTVSIQDTAEVENAGLMGERRISIRKGPEARDATTRDTLIGISRKADVSTAVKSTILEIIDSQKSIVREAANKLRADQTIDSLKRIIDSLRSEINDPRKPSSGTSSRN